MIIRVETIGSGVPSRPEVRWKPYRWRGKPGWDPAQLGPIPRKGTDAVLTAQRERDKRTAKFAQMRALGISVRDAGEELGVSWETARTYERQRRSGGGS